MESRLSGLENEKNQLKFGMQSQEREIERLRKGKGQIKNFEEVQSWNNQQWQARLDQSQDRVRDRDRVMAEALVQIREVTEHLQTLAVQADVLSLQTESESDRVKKLAWLFRKIKILDVKAKQYM
ncbi:hypothetical protein HRI_004561600 [Hibiscus trionum]|uniref:Uncharacterized protein n=1 Tax=Hibiscus trionum TaxID=183268 RepID=A0A9W7JBY4_HIBTR|nr:hypothetical protein HRI_004561600 [Hibiscus trionum]